MMAEKEIEVFETTTRRVTDVLKRLGVAKERMVTVITEPDGWRAISSIRTTAPFFELAARSPPSLLYIFVTRLHWWLHRHKTT
jgi:hypothetical protein